MLAEHEREQAIIRTLEAFAHDDAGVEGVRAHV